MSDNEPTIAIDHSRKCCEQPLECDGCGLLARPPLANVSGFWPIEGGPHRKGLHQQCGTYRRRPCLGPPYCDYEAIQAEHKHGHYLSRDLAAAEREASDLAERIKELERELAELSGQLWDAIWARDGADKIIGAYELASLRGCFCEAHIPTPEIDSVQPCPCCVAIKKADELAKLRALARAVVGAYTKPSHAPHTDLFAAIDALAAEIENTGGKHE